MTPLTVEDVLRLLKRRATRYWDIGGEYLAKFRTLPSGMEKSQIGRGMVDAALQYKTVADAIRAVRRAQRRRQEGTTP